jgi:hypothetical protein
VSTLRSAIDGLIASDPSGYADHEVEEELSELGRALDVLQARFLRLTAEADRRRAFARDGILSTSCFLALTCDLANSTAREKVAVARALETMPQTAAAFEAGELSYSKVRLLAGAAGAHPESFHEHEDTLLDVAGRLTVRDLRRAIDYWRHNLDGPEALLEMVERSYVHVARTWEGMVRIDGLLDPESGETVITALEAAMLPPAARATDEHRPTAGRRRAEALAGVCRSFLDRGETTSGGEPPHITVLVDLETLEGRAGYVCELDHTGSIPAETARRLACDARVTRVITRGGCQPLDVGRASRTVTPAQRRAVIVRDRHCRYPGCDRPARWCDVHHLVHWADGGPTDLDNLILLCRRHHTLVHERGYPLGWRRTGERGTRDQPSPTDRAQGARHVDRRPRAGTDRGEDPAQSGPRRAHHHVDADPPLGAATPAGNRRTSTPRPPPALSR